MKNLITEAHRVAGTSRHWESSNVACICHPERAVANATASRRIPAQSVAKEDASMSSLVRLLKAWRIAKATILEIFDENAYQRFLTRTNTSRSVASYREFLREHTEGIVHKPKCC